MRRSLLAVVASLALACSSSDGNDTGDGGLPDAHVPTEAKLVASANSVLLGIFGCPSDAQGSVAITNRGETASGPMTITTTEGISVSGCGGVLAAGASCTLTIVVEVPRPTPIGQVTVTAQPGTATPLVITVTAIVYLVGLLSANPSAVHLGTVRAGIVVPLPKITVTARFDLADLAVSTSGPDVAIDEQNTTCTSVLAMGQTCIVAVNFLATTAGNKEDAILISAGGPGCMTRSVPITASAVVIFPDGGVVVPLDGSVAQPLDGGADVPLDGNVAEALDGGAAVPLDGGAGTGVDAGGHTFRFAPEIVAKGCAKALACANDPAGYSEGLGRCVADLSRSGTFDFGRQTMLLSFIDDNDWLLQLALMQNMDCVQAASDCPAMLACVNQGQVQPACTPPAGYVGKRRCSDATHLRGCSFANTSASVGGVEVTFDCGALGLECVETAAPSNDRTFAACAVRVASPKPAAVTVTAACQGDVARFEFGSGAYTFDCSTFGATCVPGDFTLEDDMPCVGKRTTACGPEGFVKRCEEDTLIDCIGGQEAAQDCSAWGAICGTPPGIFSAARCEFVCELSPDSCSAGVVDYCGPDGMTPFSCASVGMTTCQIDATYQPAKAWCVPP